MGRPVAAARGGIAGRAVRAIADPRGVMREIIQMRPSEGALLGFVAVSCLFWFLGRYARVSLDAPLGDEMVGRVQAEFVTSIFFRALGLYMLAGLAGLVARALGGSGSWWMSRAATFWAALVAAPISLAGVLLAGLAPDAFGPALRSAGGLVFAWVFAMSLAEVHGFRTVSTLIGVAVVLLGVGAAAVFVA